MSIPRIFHLTSPTTALTWEERRIVARLQRTLPGWTCKHWDDTANSALMHRAFPHLAARFDAIRFGVMKADIARYAYMHVDGGFYFDTDYKLLAALAPALLERPCVLPIEEGALGQPDFKLGNAVFGSEPGHPFWASLIEHIFVAHLPERLTDHRQIPMVSGPRGSPTSTSHARAVFKVSTVLHATPSILTAPGSGWDIAAARSPWARTCAGPRGAANPRGAPSPTTCAAS